jgi:hypothetical protein
MTISRRMNQAANIKTLLNLSTSKRSFMILSNPQRVENENWYTHLHLFGISFIYFSVDTPSADYADEYTRSIGWVNTINGTHLFA